MTTHNHRLKRLLLGVLIVLCLAAPALADYQKAQQLYEAGNYAGAAAEFQQVIAAKPTYGMAHYKLGLSLLKLDQPEQALQAFARAQQLDPTLATRTNIAKMVGIAQNHLAKPHKQTVPAGSAPPLAPDVSQAIVRALQAGPIWVSPGMAAGLPQDQQARLNADLTGLQLKVRAVVVEDAYLRRSAPSIGAYAKGLAQYLNLSTDDALIVVSDKGLSVAAPALTQDDERVIAERARPAFARSYYDGIKEAAQATQETIEANQRAGTIFLAIGSTVGIAGLAGIIWWWRRRRRQQLADLRRQANELLPIIGELADGVSIDVKLLADSPQQAEVQQLYDSGIQLFAKASQQLQTAKDLPQYRALVKDLRKAESDLQECQKTCQSVLLPSAPALKSHCLACSKPIQPQATTPVTLERGRHKVRGRLCADCAREYQASPEQQLRVVSRRQGDNYTPWYEIDRYDYNRDRSMLIWCDLDTFYPPSTPAGGVTLLMTGAGLDEQMERATEGVLSDDAGSAGFQTSSSGGESGSASFLKDGS